MHLFVISISIISFGRRGSHYDHLGGLGKYRDKVVCLTKIVLNSIDRKGSVVNGSEIRAASSSLAPLFRMSIRQSMPTVMTTKPGGQAVNQAIRSVLWGPTVLDLLYPLGRGREDYQVGFALGNSVPTTR